MQLITSLFVAVSCATARLSLCEKTIPPIGSPNVESATGTTIEPATDTAEVSEPSNVMITAVSNVSNVTSNGAEASEPSDVVITAVSKVPNVTSNGAEVSEPTNVVITAVPKAPNVTWNGCKCKMDGPAINGCSNTCCPSQLHLGTTWCFVEDKDCEDSEFGYCKPDDYVPQVCRDWPKGWHDSQGHDCGAYGRLGLCTVSGLQGANWNEAVMGNFSTSKDADAAKHTCCNCGGGFVPTTCKDFSGWKDADEDRCQTYSEHNWCDSQGQSGLGWFAEWGPLSDRKDVNGYSALDACCACGGGDSLQEASKPSSTATWRGCKCREGWTHSGMACQGACCNPDKSPFGDWCAVEDPECQRSSWGYCRPSGVVPRTCEDTSKNWKDKYGHGCNEYGLLGLCNADRSKGAGWKQTDLSFANASIDGSGADVACCNCGGGKAKGNCADSPDWKDAVGDGCHEYQEYGMCNANGGEGAGWQDDYGDFERLARSASGKHVRDACCACGKQIDTLPEKPAQDDWEVQTSTSEMPVKPEQPKPTEQSAQPSSPTSESGISFSRFFIGGIVLATCGFAVWKWNQKGGDDQTRPQGSARRYGKKTADGL